MSTEAKIAGFIIAICVIGFLVSLSMGIVFSPSGPPPSELVLQGKALAEQHCARCHDVKGEGPSPLRGAPAFLVFFQTRPPTDLGHAMDEGISVGHETQPMPVFTFTPEENDALIAYLQYLQKSKAADHKRK